jgi:hypothetical protein
MHDITARLRLSITARIPPTFAGHVVGYAREPGCWYLTTEISASASALLLSKRYRDDDQHDCRDDQYDARAHQERSIPHNRATIASSTLSAQPRSRGLRKLNLLF